MKVLFGSASTNRSPEFSFYFEGPGSATCQAACEHCFIPRPRKGDTPLQTCLEQYHDLVERSYLVEPKVPDTFSRGGEYLRNGILKGNRLYSQEDVKDCGVAWTSGLPLLRGDTNWLLALAHDCNLRIIAFTGHALRGLIKGMVPARSVEAAIRRVQEWNERHLSKDRFMVSITFTIGRFNSNSDSVRNYIDYARKLGVDFIRFSRFVDATESRKFKGLVMNKEETAQFFADIAPVLSCYDSPTVMISSDLGFVGIEAIGGHKGLNDCPGGTGGFAIFNSLIFPCDEVLKNPIGELVRSDGRGWDLHFRPGALEALAAAKRHPAYSGCIAHLLWSEGITI